MYAITPGTIPVKRTKNIHRRRKAVTSTLKYSARPAQTPAIFLSVLLLYNFLYVFDSIV